MRWFKRSKAVEPYQPSAVEEAEMRESVREQVQEMVVGETFWGEFSNGQPWEFTLESFDIDEFRMSIDWE